MDLQSLARNLADLILPWISRTIYATGTFTPTWLGTTTAGVFTYDTAAGTNYGRWVRIFDMVYISCRVSITAITTPPVGFMRIGGMASLPDPDVATAAEYAVTFGLIQNMDLPAGFAGFTAWIVNDTSEPAVSLRVWRDNNTSSRWDAANFTNAAAACQISGWYRATS